MISNFRYAGTYIDLTQISNLILQQQKCNNTSPFTFNVTNCSPIHSSRHFKISQGFGNDDSSRIDQIPTQVGNIFISSLVTCYITGRNTKT